MAVAGVATGVGFSIVMAALMQGSQADFTRQLIDALPHITVTDERRQAPQQPAEVAFDAVEDPRAHARSAPARHQEPDGDHGVARGLGAGCGGAGDQDAGPHPLCQPGCGGERAGHRPAPRAQGVDAGDPDAPRHASIASTAPPTPSYSERVSPRRSAHAVGSNITVQTTDGANLNAQVVGLFRSGVRSVDESSAYVLVKTAQILAQQTGLVNEIRVRVSEPMAAQAVAQRIERESGYKSVSWQEAHEDLLSAFVVRNIIMYTVVGAILLVASFGTYNIISTITHEKTRDIAILKSLGLREVAVRRIFVLEALAIGLIGALAGWLLGYALTRAPRHHRDQEPDDRCDPAAVDLLVLALRHRSQRSAPLLAGRRLLPGAQGLAPVPRGHHSRGHVSDERSADTQLGATGSEPLIAASGVTRILPGAGTDDARARHRPDYRRQAVRCHHGPVGLG